MWRGPRWLFAIVRADTGVCPYRWVCHNSLEGYRVPLGGRQGGLSGGRQGGLYVNKSKIACYIMDVKNREKRVAGGGRQETM